MSEVLQAIFTIITWTFVPGILVLAIAKSYTLADKIEHKTYKAAARSGFTGGLVLFFITIIYQLGQYSKNGFPEAPMYQGFNLWLALGSAAATFAIFYGGRMVSVKFVGWIVLIISFASFWALFHYVFVHTANQYILSSVLGIAFGVFCHTAFSPVSIDDLLKFF